MAKVSIIVPIYGVEKYLRECLDSILNQSLKEIEILLIDDGSKDTCPQICDEYGQKDERIKVIHKPNGGYGSACNIGLNSATGEYLAIVEPDDYIDSKMYEDLYKIAKEFDSDVVKSCFYDNLQTDCISRCKKTKWDNDKIPQDRSFDIKECSLFLYYHPSIWSCIYKREFIEKHGIRFIEAAGAGWTDNPFQVQTMCLAERINYTEKAYYYWRRLNEYGSDDLKDWTIPFKRSEEIHKWLEENNINHSGILANLYRRELAYMLIVLGMKNISDIEACLTSVKKILTGMDKRAFLERRDEKRLYNQLLNNPLKVRNKLFCKRFGRWLLGFRIGKREKYIRFLGKTIHLGGLNA